MTDKLKIQNTTFKTSPKLKTEILNYLTLIDENFSPEIANDLKQSMVENLVEACQNNEILEANFVKIVAQIGKFQKPIYKTFLRYKGCLAGVCDGIATYFNIKTIWIRSFFAIPILFLISVFLDNFKYDIFPGLPFFGSIFFDIQENNKYFAKPILNSCFELSLWIILIYVLIWVSIPKVKTELEEKQLKSDWFFNEEIEKSIFNKITLKNKWGRRILTKIFLGVAKIGVFAFDIAIAVTNNIFKSWSLRTLFWIILICLVFDISINIS